jgi:hypothetical protein
MQPSKSPGDGFGNEQTGQRQDEGSQRIATVKVSRLMRQRSCQFGRREAGGDVGGEHDSTAYEASSVAESRPWHEKHRKHARTQVPQAL